MSAPQSARARLLLSARDPGSAGHIQAILHEAARHPWLEVRVHADDPAYDALRRAHPEVARFGGRASVDPSPEDRARLVGEARRIVEAEQPDAVLVGVSHVHEAGLDEAFLAAAFDRPAFAMQDFWGDANLNLGRAADLYFALDEAAVRLTRERHGCAAMACGSPKHARYADLDVLAMRRAARAALGIADERPVVGYFGQALTRLAGYRATLHEFTRAIAATPQAHVFYKPHPRETPEEVSATIACFAQAGRRVATVVEGSTEDWLAASDVAVCCFSSCGYDAAFLNRACDRPVVAPLYLLFDAEIVGYFRSVTDLAVPPPSELGIVRSVTRAEALGEELRRALSPEGREDAWNLALRHLPDPKGAAGAILGEIARRVRAPRAAHWAEALAGARG